MPKVHLRQPFYFIRHGETDWNAAERYQGTIDIPLNENGIAQAHAAAKALQEHNVALTSIFTSTLLRARVTAEIIHSYFKHVPLIQVPHLRERHFGAYEGRRRPEIQKELGLKRHEKIHHYPADAEQFEAMCTRTLSAIADIQERHPHGVLIVSHGAVLRGIATKLLNEPDFTVPNGTPFLFSPIGNKWKVDKFELSTTQTLAF